MTNRYVYIFIEVARREMDSRLALALELAKKGYSVMVGEKNQLLWNMFAGKYPPGVILDKCAQIADNPKFEILIKKGFVYTVLDEEGLITNADYFTKNRFSRRAEKYVAANFVVGTHLNDIILSEYKSANNIISGNPRYSMLNPEWKYWFANEYDQVKAQYGNFVLLVSSFNPYPQVYQHTVSGMKQIDDYFKKEMQSYLTENMDKGLNFVLRPHPSDQPYGYQAIEVDERFNIIPWIMASEYLINAKCTTSLEAFIAGKRAYTWKLPTREPAYKLANFFADDLQEFGKPVPESTQIRRARVLERLLSHAGSADASVNIISHKIEELSFSAKGAPAKYSVHKIMHLKNQLRYFVKGDDYIRIKQKFTHNDIKYAQTKVSAYYGESVINDKVLEINC